MPFPEAKRVIYSSNPLVEVVCQFRFPEILSIKTKEPADFQEQIRRHFPIYKKNIESPLPADIPDEIKNFLGASTGKQVHIFQDLGEKRQIHLTSDFLAIATSDYKKYEDFRKYVLIGLKALNIYKPSFFTRVGLRYKDLIDRSIINSIKNCGWRELLNIPILGELGDDKIGNEIKGIKRQISLLTEDTKLVINHGLVKIENRKDPCYLIDSDFYITENCEVNHGIEHLDRFHKLAGKMFRWAITDKLHEAMGPKPVR